MILVPVLLDTLFLVQARIPLAESKQKLIKDKIIVERFGLYILNSFKENKYSLIYRYIKSLVASFKNKSSMIWTNIFHAASQHSVKCEFKIKIILLAKSWIFTHLLPIFIKHFHAEKSKEKSRRKLKS